MNAKTREQVEQEARELSRWKENLDQTVKCDYCGGTGQQRAPLFDDPALGYGDAGQCPWCKGSGKDKTKIFI